MLPSDGLSIRAAELRHFEEKQDIRIELFFLFFYIRIIVLCTVVPRFLTSPLFEQFDQKIRAKNASEFEQNFGV